MSTTGNLPTLRQLMSELIAISSVSSVDAALDESNEAVVERLAQWLGSLGFTVEHLPVPGHRGKVNLLARLGEGPGGLILAGHTDTVPYDRDQWQSDPFELTEKGQRLYGLGISDMKGFLALAVEAASHYEAGDLAAPLVLLATADEESGMHGARALAAKADLQADAAVIGEPTGLVPVMAHKGVMMVRIRLVGRSGHASNPALGASALEGMREILNALVQWREALSEQWQNPRFDVPAPTLNLGTIRGGDNPNRICAECDLQIDIRPLPGMDPAELLDALRQCADTAVAGRGLTLTVEPLFEPIPAMETPADTAVVEATESLTGKPAQAVAFGTEGPFLNALGIPTVILGPGDIAQAHQPDEYLAVERIAPMQRIIHGLIQRFCLRHD